MANALLQDLRSLIDHLDRLGRDCVGQPGSGALAVWQVAALELRDRLQELDALRPGSGDALRRLAALEQGVAGLAREVRAEQGADLPPAADLGPLLQALSALAGKLSALRALHLGLARGPGTCRGPAGVAE